MSLDILRARNGCVQFNFDQSIEEISEEPDVLVSSCKQIYDVFKRVVIDGGLLGIVVLLDYVKERWFGE